MTLAHFKHSSDRRSRFEKTDPRWLKAGSQLQDVVNGWASRDDIVSYLGEGAADGSAGAAFSPDLAEMEVNVTAAFGEGCDPAWLGDLTDRDVQFDHPAALGAVLHEAMHAKHSEWDLRDFARSVRDPFEAELVTSFEETRIEARGVAAMPENRSFLRACALKLVIGDLAESKADFAAGGHQSLSKLALLTLARVDAGSVDEGDVTPVREAAVRAWGEELLGELRGVWLRAQAHSADADWRPLHRLALEWIKLLEDAGHDPRKESEVPEWLKELLAAMIGAAMAGGDGDGDEEGEGGKGGKGEPEEDGKPGPGAILVVLADDAETAAREEGTDQQVREMAEEMRRQREQASAEEQEHEQRAQEVFGRGTGPGPAKTNSRLREKRPPTGPERAAAVRLAKDLERARYRDRIVDERRTVVPPGRLRMRAAMAADAERHRGMAPTQAPWKSKRRFHQEDPNLAVGVMVDISGSMSKAMEPMAATAWVLSEAVKRVQGRAAMMYFGNDVFPVLAPGQHLDQVHVYSAADGTERFEKGWKALNGRMNLLGSSGARLLVVVSDLWHQPHEVEAERRWFERCRRDGVAVVVVAPDTHTRGNADEIVGQNGTVVQLDLSDVAATARLIGDACVRQLQKASR